MEAAEEIARQLRLRDLGGIIVIDFIDMERARNRSRVTKAFEAALKRDRQRTKILHLSPLGLVEMTRKRRGESLTGILTETCPHCAGLGRVRRPLTIALKLEREAYRLAAEDKAKAEVIRAAASVADILIGERGARAAALETRAGTTLYIRADHNLAVEEHELLPTSRAEAERLVSSHSRGEEVVLDRVDPPQAGEGDEAYGWAGGYRVLVDSTDPVAEGTVVVLTEAGRSFGRGHVKGAAPAAQPARRKGGKPAAARKRRRPRRKAKAVKGGPTAEAAGEAGSDSRRTKKEAARPEGSREQAAAPQETPAAGTAKKKQGLLRRGARRLARGLRQPV
jgi:ribonuclease G